MTGKLLLAAPAISDPRFERAVIFICAHDEQGAMGFMVNHSMPEVRFDQIIEQTGLSSEIEIDLNRIKVMSGGPVEESRGFLLHTTDFLQKDTVRISRDYGVTGTLDALRDLLKGKGPKDMLFVLGHAGWSAGQLEQELQGNSWLVTDPTPDLIFKTPTEKKWNTALSSMGIDLAMLSGISGNA
jgi:putative transcriptional regulator